MNRLNSSFILLLLLAAFLIRVVALGRVPPPLFRDEAEKGYNAYCLLKTGCDYQGRRLPLFVNVFGAHTSALYQYASVPWIGLFGLKVWTTRLTAALVGVLTVFVLYLLGRALFDPATALVAAAILAVSPWHVCFSRWAQQGILMPLLFTVAAWGTVRFRQGWRAGLPIAAAAVALAAYAYDVGRVLAPLFLLLLVVIARRELREQARWTVASALLLAILVAPTLWFVTHQPEEAMARFRRISIAQPGMTPPEVAGRFIANYAAHFDPLYLAWRGDRELRHSTGLTGEIYPLELLFFLLGLCFLARRRDAATAMVIGWLLIAPIAASMTREGIPHALRSLAGVPAFALGIAVGFVEVVHRLSGKSKFWTIVIVASIEAAGAAFFLYGYFAVYPRLSAPSWQAGVGEALAYCDSRDQPDGEIWISEAVGGMVMPPEMISPAELFVAFYERIPPRPFQQSRLRQTRFRVVPYGASLSDLLTRAKTKPMDIVAFVQEMPNRAPVASFGAEWPIQAPVAVHQVGVYRP